MVPLRPEYIVDIPEERNICDHQDKGADRESIAPFRLVWKAAIPSCDTLCTAALEAKQSIASSKVGR
jgi:hypothetical protein